MTRMRLIRQKIAHNLIACYILHSKVHMAHKRKQKVQLVIELITNAAGAI